LAAFIRPKAFKLQRYSGTLDNILPGQNGVLLDLTVYEKGNAR